MSCVQPGHLTQRPSGTRLALSADGAIGLRAFLNHDIGGHYVGQRSMSKTGFRLRASGFGPHTLQAYRACSPAGPKPEALCARHVIPRPALHRPDLANEIVEGLVAGVQIHV